MSLIIWDPLSRTLATDSSGHIDGQYAFPHKHVFMIDKSKSGDTYFAIVGDPDGCAEALSYMTDPDDFDDAPDMAEFFAIVVRPIGAYRVTTTFDEVDLPGDRPVCIGTGWQWAQAWLDAGKTIEEAVNYAATRDSLTVGPAVLTHIPQVTTLKAV